MRSLMAIVDKLDIRRAQVLVEAIIVDVSVNKYAELGVNWAVWSDEDDTRIPAGAFISPVGGVNLGQLAQAVNNPTGVAVGSIPAGTTFGIGRIAATGVNFAAMIRALQGDSNTNLIATPSTVTMDNQEAELKVAQEVPFITGQFTNTGQHGNNGEVNPFTTVQREEVGTILKITPQINEGDARAAQDRASRARRCPATTGDANSAHHQQAHHQHQRADRGRRHRRARRPDPGRRHTRRAARALPRPHPGDRRAVQDSQPQTRRRRT